MNITRYCRLVLFFSCLFLFLSGCNNNATEPSKQERDSKLMTHDDENQQHVEELEGGSELASREQTPVSFWTLQREYPNSIAIRANNTKKMAITFDDGPSQKYTPLILDTLKKHKAKATFFMMGSRASAYPDIVKRIHEEGHAIGNHTYWHPNLSEANINRMKKEISDTENTIAQIVNIRPRLFRPPYGNLTREQVKVLEQMNLSAIMWSVDSSDWQQLSAEQIQKNVLSNIHPGAVILFHDGGHWTQDLSGTVEALDIIIPKLQNDGIELVTIPELFQIEGQK
jgi:peptidoglycan-N-acetylglucosamine deacetylase